MATTRNITSNNDTRVRKQSGIVQKRFRLDEIINDKVEGHRRIMSVRWAEQGRKEEPLWVHALEELLKTHPELKKIKV